MKNEVGNKYGKLTVIAKEYSSQNGIYWRCKCDCGNECVVRGCHLRSGHTTSCGCVHGGGPGIKNLLGQRFGKLVVVEFAYTKNQRAYWKCQCDCGTSIIVRSDHLCGGLTTSCGCIKSKGEEFVSSILTNLGVNFSKEYSFVDLKDKGVLKFDFAIHKEKLFLIEYDGSQHFYSSSGWNSEDNWKELQKRDTLKNNYCIQNNIPLLRLNYKQSKEEILQNIRQFLNLE